METERVYGEIFDRYYTAGVREVKAGRYVQARRELACAVKTLYEMAKLTEGREREEQLIRAEKLYNDLHKLKRMSDKKPVPVSENKSGANGNCGTGTAGTGGRGNSPEDKILNGGRERQGREKMSGDTQEERGRVFTAMNIPSITFEDIAGLNDVKEAIYSKIIEPRQYPELYAKYRIKNGGGVLMYGPPGTGKTMIAKAIAHEVGAKFFAVRCSDLVSRYFGGTEQNINALFETARAEKCAVIFLDEFEAIGVSRDKTHSSVMSRVVPELLTQMQGVKEDNGNGNGNGNDNGRDDEHILLLLAATNMPWAIDSAFLRPGRFDERIYVGLPDDEARRGIFERAFAKLKDIPKSDDLDIGKLVAYSEGFNCSDVTQLIETAKRFPLKREQQSHLPEMLCMSDFENAFKTCHSSVVKSDIEKIRAWETQNGR